MRSRLSDYFNDVTRITPSFVINAVTHKPTIMYIHLLLGLRDRKLGSINGSFAGTLHCAMKVLESSWKELVHDIESGIINDKKSTSGSVRPMSGEIISQSRPGEGAGVTY